MNINELDSVREDLEDIRYKSEIREIERRFNEAYLKHLHCPEKERAKSKVELDFWSHKFFTYPD
jgi:hypothetical protein